MNFNQAVNIMLKGGIVRRSPNCTMKMRLGTIVTKIGKGSYKVYDLTMDDLMYKKYREV